MKLTAKLAYKQLIINRRRTVWTLAGIILSAAMLTAILGFIASGEVMITEVSGRNIKENEILMNSIIGAGSVLGLIIASVSAVVVSNAFRVSAGERTAQFGMLKSVGAAKRQIAATVMYEGLWLSLIGIPAGIVLGMGVHSAGIGIANYYLTSINKLNSGNIQVNLKFVLKWWAPAISSAASFLVVLISAWLPAHRAAKISAIEAIRGAGEVIIKTNRLRTSRIIGRIFGFEGTLAAKSLKRSRRNFRATVISLAVSIVLIIAADGIKTFGISTTDLYYHDIDVDVIVDYESKTVAVNNDEGSASGFLTCPIEYDLAEEITKKLREYPDTEVLGVGTEWYTYSTVLPREMLAPKMIQYLDSQLSGETAHEEYKLFVNFVILDRENYGRMCGIAGAETGANILVNCNKTRLDGIRAEFEPFIFDFQTLVIKDVRNPNQSPGPSELPLHGVLQIKDVPNEIVDFLNANSINIIVPGCDSFSYEWLAKTTDDEGFAEYAADVLDELIPPGEGYETAVASVAVVIQAMTDIRSLILTFIYGFTGMLILIGLTNVISTISTNIRSRLREFAMLRSVGMTFGGLGKMLNLESVLCSVRALLFGLPAGCVLSYLMYRSIVRTADFPYEFPWTAVLQCVAGVFFLTWAVMRYSVTRIRNKNIIDSIRSENR